MKAVLLPIHPQYCELIADGEKTVEVRKTRPKLDTPFKCYMYCTKPKYPHEDFICIGAGTENARAFYGGGKVIGEFVCEKIGEAHSLQDFRYAGVYKEWDDKADCLTNKQMLDYMGENDLLYGWHISDLVIYDEPKKLDEFYRFCRENTNCGGCEAHYYSSTECGTEEYCCSLLEGCKPITRPPQSWCYVEELT